MSEALARLMIVTERIAVTAEEVVLARALSAPPDGSQRGWSLACLESINERIADLGLADALEDARAKLLARQTWLGSARSTSTFERARAEAEAAGQGEEVRLICKV